MKILVTAGNTQTPLDRVRCITNIFSGRTGTGIAHEARRRGHDVCLLTSHPELATNSESMITGGNLTVHAFRTFDDLAMLMTAHVSTGKFDAVIHCAAVSDFQVSGVFAPSADTAFDAETCCWRGNDTTIQMIDVARGKVKSNHADLWIRLAPTPKLVDRIRTAWKFGGILVKFKLEVGVSINELKDIATGSRLDSGADLIVANTFDGMHEWALLGTHLDLFATIRRCDLAKQLLAEIECLQQARDREHLLDVVQNNAFHSSPAACT